MSNPKPTGYHVESDDKPNRHFLTFAEAEAFARRRAKRDGTRSTIFDPNDEEIGDVLRDALDRVWLQLTVEGGWFLDESGL